MRVTYIAQQGGWPMRVPCTRGLIACAIDQLALSLFIL